MQRCIITCNIGYCNSGHATHCPQTVTVHDWAVSTLHIRGHGDIFFYDENCIKKTTFNFADYATHLFMPLLSIY